jgi:hypothetical protein
MFCITFTDLHMLNHPCVTGIENRTGYGPTQGA